MGQDLQYPASSQTYFEGQFKLPFLMNTKSEGFFFFFLEGTKCEVGECKCDKTV